MSSVWQAGQLCLCAGAVKLDVTVMPGSGQFVVSENGALVAGGRISVPPDASASDDCDSRPTPVVDARPLPLNAEDIYQEMRLRGYDYGPTFRGIISADATGVRPQMISCLTKLFLILFMFCKPLCRHHPQRRSTTISGVIHTRFHCNFITRMLYKPP